MKDPEEYEISKNLVRDSLAYFYDLETLGWKTHNSNEFSDPSGHSAMKDKECYVKRGRGEAEQVYQPTPPSIYVDVKNVDASFNPASVHPDQVGCILGHNAGHVDDLEDTWEINIVLEFLDAAVDTAVEGVNTVADYINSAVEVVLAPIYSLIFGICRLFGGCDDWPSPGNVVPDIPDIPEVEFPYGEGPYKEILGNDLTRFWHFINMVPFTSMGLVTWGNHAMYDDHDGYHWTHGIRSIEEFGIDAGCKALQAHIIPEYSNDPCSSKKSGPIINYQIPNSDDDHKATLVRSPLSFFLPTVLSVVFNPVDNLAKYGWDSWIKTGDIFYLGYTLHAIADAGTAHHTANTMFRNHTDYEDYIQKRYDFASEESPYVFNQDKNEYAAIWLEIHDFMKIVDAYWAKYPSRKLSGDIPVRNLMTKLAENVWNDSLTSSLYDDNPNRTKWLEHAKKALTQVIAVITIVLIFAPKARLGR